jgi:hypothetical protein
VRLRLWRPHRRLDHPDAFGAEDLVEAARELAVAVTNEKTDRLLRSTVRKSQAMIEDACARRNSDQVSSARRGAGSIPCRRRIAQIVLGASATPRPTSSPWMRREPPGRILTRKPRHEFRDASVRSRAAEGRPRVCPTARDQLAMPAQQRRRRDKERRPRSLRQRAASRSQATAGRPAAAAGERPDAARHAIGGAAQGSRAPLSAPSAAEAQPARAGAGAPSTANG